MRQNQAAQNAGVIPAIAYARQSDTKEGSGSLTDQIAELRRSAERLGLVIVAELVEPDSTSGYKGRGLHRPEWKTLLDMIRKGEARAVIVLSTDRLSRGGGPGYLPFYEAIEEAKLDPDRVVATPGGWVSEWELGIRSAMDREESKKIAMRIKLVRRREAEAGKPRGGGKRPYGYEPDLVTIRESEAELIREAARRILDGESAYGVAHDWNAKGIRGGTGGHWQTQNLKRVLCSPRIAGFREHTPLDGQTALYPAVWPAILDRETWERVRAAVIQNAARHPQRVGGRTIRRPRTHLLSGFLECGRCGTPMVGRTRRDRGVRGEYMCPRPEHGGRGDSCGGIVIAGNVVDEDVFRVVAGALLDPETRRRLLALAPQPEAKGPDLGAELRELEERKGRLLDLHLDGAVDRTLYEARLAEITERLDEIQTELATRAGSPVLASVPATLAELRALWDDRGLEWKRLLITAALDRVSVAPGRAARVVDRLTYLPR